MKTHFLTFIYAFTQKISGNLKNLSQIIATWLTTDK
jgi:hypothetical protein